MRKKFHLIVGLLIVSVVIFTNCLSNNKKEQPKNNTQQNAPAKETTRVTCTDSSCIGEFIGPEFINGIDTAHRLSNTVAKHVGDKLKQLYKNKKYALVDFSKLTMTTQGMGDEDNFVTYRVVIPFKFVKNPCDAMTAFDHCGGWDHKPALEERKEKLINSERTVVYCKQLMISPIFITKENLQEYWIQWRNTSFQSSCNCE